MSTMTVTMHVTNTRNLHVVLNSVVMGSSVVIVMVVLPGVLVVGMGLACRTNDGLRRR